MTPQQFVRSLQSSVIDENIALYRAQFSETEPGSASDECWKRAIALFGGLTGEQRQVFFEVIRQIAIDTASSILGMLDGVVPLEGAESGLELTCASHRLNGGLQDLLLEEDERRRPV